MDKNKRNAYILYNDSICILDNDLNRQKERHGSEYKRLVGHAGPVYGVSFSHDNKYLISCSEDKTGKIIRINI